MAVFFKMRFSETNRMAAADASRLKRFNQKWREHSPAITHLFFDLSKLMITAYFIAL